MSLVRSVEGNIDVRSSVEVIERMVPSNHYRRSCLEREVTTLLYRFLWYGKMINAIILNTNEWRDSIKARKNYIKILGSVFYLVTQHKMSFYLFLNSMNNKDRMILVSTCITKWKAFVIRLLQDSTWPNMILFIYLFWIFLVYFYLTLFTKLYHYIISSIKNYVSTKKSN